MLDGLHIKQSQQNKTVQIRHICHQYLALVLIFTFSSQHCFDKGSIISIYDSILSDLEVVLFRVVI